MKTLDVLIKARKILSNSKRWTKKIEYYNGAYCAVGALRRGAGAYPSRDSGGLSDRKLDDNAYRKALEYLNAAVASKSRGMFMGGYHTAMAFNDDPMTEHADVLAVYDQAIKNCKRRHMYGGR